MAAAAVESGNPYPESPYDADDVAFPCKGCGEILEEGKAFELAGNRWHIDCFRCNTCGTLLDSDANLLLLGDGSLICNNCTYSCSGCGSKIEDLAILTGDQAFCSDCFKCRNCKKKIENLRYARTSQGIFCMDCHEALMARRRKKTGRNPASRSKLSNNIHLDKSLPPPPPSDSAPYQQTDSEYGSPYVSPPLDSSVPSISKTVEGLRQTDSREEDLTSSTTLNSHSPSNEPDSTFKGGLTLPSTTFNGKRGSFIAPKAEPAASGEEFLVPVAFDPSPAVQSPPQQSQQREVPKITEERPRDYFSRSQNSQSTKISSPHITSQLQGLQRSQQSSSDTLRNKKDDSSSLNNSTVASPQLPSERQFSESSSTSQSARTGSTTTEDKFKLQDAPSTKRMHSSQSSRSDSGYTTGYTTALPQDPADVYTTPRHSIDDSPSIDQSPRPPQHPALLAASLPKRGDSLDRAKMNQGKTIARKEINTTNTPSSLGDVMNQKPNNASEAAKVNGGKVISAPIESPKSKSIYDTPTIPTHDQKESFTEPRSAPMPPPGSARSRNESVSTIQSDMFKAAQKSPSLPRYSAGGDFTMDEDMARILGNENAEQSFLKRVSNSVRHGRSYSDKAGRMSRDKWPRSPALQDISSPSTASLDGVSDQLAFYKNQTRDQRVKLIAQEKRIAELEAQIASSQSISQVNSELREKRSTMVVLDTQKEIVVRELELMTEHLAAVKANKEPMDVGKMTNTVLREFAASLERLKNSFTPQLEDLIERRNSLLEEIANLTTVKDKSFAEFEQLSSKNAQLAELNNQLVHQIQNLYKANSGQTPEQTKTQVNGLGIYTHHKDKSIEQATLSRNLSTDNSLADSGTTLGAGEAEPVTVLQGPQVVNIRKGQPKKFDWRKGQKVAKGVTKGIKGAFSSAQQNYSRDLQFAETGAYGQQPAGQGPEYGATLPRQGQDAKGFGFFGGGPKAGGKGMYGQGNNSEPSLLDASIHLFGSDLEQRTEYEGRSVPVIVKRCIDEVETRGMDTEGIYRKSGGNSQVQQVRDVFERPSVVSHEISEVISDPDMDIHAITSGLKQYFRKLPIPLITFDVYDKLLDTTTIENRDEKVAAMREAVKALPPVHYEVLEYLMRHLDRVVELKEENLMTSTNIAVVFAPTIMRPESLARELGDTKAKNEAVTVLVEEVDRIFR
ncbi:Beta-chimaerin [Cyphellophora attinorum]|uniref:Beta-chimaerin n=1 Tax=Cyphellophora attinorum TaxID=1664694 RepID=A0A0N1HE02_9EURO|nr:Beta-chimaerin [Phialophora attinorum]KPI43447.1 Beta-chimaerin [Phialophora attinorum]